jgi:NAD-dependent dihydropyrimidine dehydrogenase PreA subunit
MPYNIIFRYEDALAKQMYIYMQKTAKEYAHKVIIGTKEKISKNVISLIASFILRIQWPGARLNGKLYSANKKCTLCLKCVKECPVKNISTKDGGIRFGGNCIMCMRCSMRCPEEAINIGLLRFWVVRGEYDFNELVRDDSLPDNFVNVKTKGYFALFKKYFGVK